MPNKHGYFRCLALLLGLLLSGLGLGLLGQEPNPPGTGPFTVQMFLGGTQNTYLCLYPPTTYTDGTPIPNGTGVTIRIYRSATGAPGTFTTPVQILSGGSGSVGQGAAGTRQKPWIDLTVKTPVDCLEPRIVFLAAAAVVNGVEGPQTTNDLSFRYAIGGTPGSPANCYPQLIRYPNPAAALAAAGTVALPTGGVPPGSLAPNPPGTGPFTVQMFMGGTQFTFLCFYPPSTYVDGSPIPAGRPVQIKLYRSYDQGGSYTTPVAIASGGTGSVGQGPAGSRQKPWIDVKAITPVDCIEPRVIFLAATAVVDGVESAPTVNNLTFRYAAQGPPGSTEDCYPYLERYATPLGAGVGRPTLIPTGPPRRAGGGGGGAPLNASIALVIDMSGSMNEVASAGAGRKVDIAKSAAVEALKKMPTGTEVCLFSFGRVDCDVNLESVFTTDFNSLAGKVQSLNGNGRTPLAAAIYKARDFIVNNGQGKTGQIVLLSDGNETCQGDPVKAASDVRNKAYARTTRGPRTSGFSLFPMLYAGEPGQANDPAQTVPPSPMQLTPEQLQDEEQRAQSYDSEDPSQLPPEEIPPQPSPGAGTTPGAGAGRQQMDITISTIGLGLAVNSPEQQALDRIAQVGGGQSYSTQNLNQLTQAFTQAIAQPAAPAGGGGGPIIPGEGGFSGTWVLLIALLAAIVILLVIILVVRRSKSGAPTGPKVRATLEIIWSDGSRQEYALRQARTTIGRDADNSLQVGDAMVSGHHAEILASATGFSIRDLGSSNGTLVNGKRITQSPLYAGDKVQLGSTTLILKG
jgi:hypothetical protein